MSRNAGIYTAGRADIHSTVGVIQGGRAGVRIRAGAAIYRIEFIRIISNGDDGGRCIEGHQSDEAFINEIGIAHGGHAGCEVGRRGGEGVGGWRQGRKDIDAVVVVGDIGKDTGVNADRSGGDGIRGAVIFDSDGDGHGEYVELGAEEVGGKVYVSLHAGLDGIVVIRTPVVALCGNRFVTFIDDVGRVGLLEGIVARILEVIHVAQIRDRRFVFLLEGGGENTEGFAHNAAEGISGNGDVGVLRHDGAIEIFEGAVHQDRIGRGGAGDVQAHVSVGGCAIDDDVFQADHIIFDAKEGCVREPVTFGHANRQIGNLNVAGRFQQYGVGIVEQTRIGFDDGGRRVGGVGAHEHGVGDKLHLLLVGACFQTNADGAVLFKEILGHEEGIADTAEGATACALWIGGIDHGHVDPQFIEYHHFPGKGGGGIA